MLSRCDENSFTGFCVGRPELYCVLINDVYCDLFKFKSIIELALVVGGVSIYLVGKDKCIDRYYDPSQGQGYLPSMHAAPFLPSLPDIDSRVV